MKPQIDEKRIRQIRYNPELVKCIWVIIFATIFLIGISEWPCIQ